MASKAYTRLSEAKITDSRTIVVSRCESGEILLAQKVQMVEGTKTTDMFMSGAIKVEADRLQDVRDAINEAIEKLG